MWSSQLGVFVCNGVRLFVVKLPRCCNIVVLIINFRWFGCERRVYGVHKMKRNDNREAPQFNRSSASIQTLSAQMGYPTLYDVAWTIQSKCFFFPLHFSSFDSFFVFFLFASNLREFFPRNRKSLVPLCTNANQYTAHNNSIVKLSRFLDSIGR